MPLTLAICEDSEQQSAELRRLLGEWSSDKPFALIIDEYISAESFLFSYPEKPCDLLLLDIEMGGINGMELAVKLRERADMLPILFITGYSEYMNQGYEVEALHYLLKPVDKEKLFNVLDRYVKKRLPENEILLRTEKGVRRVSSDTVSYCEAMGKRTLVHIFGGQCVECELGIGELKKTLTYEFVFCHRSYIVNLRFVKSIGKAELTLDSGKTVPVSRRLYNELIEKFIEFYTER